MKYQSHYESVQNCTSGGSAAQHLQQILNGKYASSNCDDDDDDSVNRLCLGTNDFDVDVSKSISSLNCDGSKKSVRRKTCTCSSGGMISCPSHGGTERSSINGYYANSFTHIQYDKINSTTTSKSNLTTTTTTTTTATTTKLKELMIENENHLPLQNGEISSNKSKHDSTLPENNESEEDALLSSRTFTIKSSKCHINNSDNVKKEISHLDELRLSLTSLISKDATTADETQETEAFQKWLAEKKRQERQIRQRESNLKQLIEQEKQRKLQMEQENFLNWLHAKKQKELQEKASKKKALEEEQRRKNEKLKREEINKKQYQLWLKLKEEQDLVKKINEQKRKIEKEERERQRLARNQSAFQEWLISSKDKPKPVPLNQGLESLRTSTSVAFVNPAPWVPNIVEKPKATSK